MTMTIMMMMTTTPTTRMTMTTTRTTMTTRVTQLWDLIEDRGFHKDIMDISNNNDDDEDDDDDDNDNNDEKKKNNNNEVEGVSALALHCVSSIRLLWFLSREQCRFNRGGFTGRRNKSATQLSLRLFTDKF